MELITRELLARLSEEARHTPRLRKNYNLHASDASKCHRLLNAVEPGSYIRPHRHMDPEKGESMVLLNGRLGVILFSLDGGIQETILLSQDACTLGVDIPAGTFHSVLSLEAGTVFFEAKAGPYLPLTGLEPASWAPEEGRAHGGYLSTLMELFCR